MKKIFLLLGVFTTLFSCSAIDEMLEKFSGDYVESVEMTVEDFEEDATTRTALSNLTDAGAKFAWAENDTVGIFPNVGDQVSFSMAAGAGTSSATFNGGGWALRTSATYSAYYPFSYANGPKDNKHIGINMVGQTQTGSDTTSEIGKYDIMATAPASAETGNVKFAFKHQVSICRIKLTLPEDRTYQSVKVIAPIKRFITKATLDISVASPTITAVETSDNISISLRNVSTTSARRDVIVNMYVLPVDMSSEVLTVEAIDTNGNVYSDKSVAGVNFEKAKIRVLNATPLASGVDGEGEGEDFTGDEITQPLTFSTYSGHTISLTNYGGNAPNLEYSVDGGPWIPWDYSPIYLNGGQKISFRGDNPSGFSKDMYKYSVFVDYFGFGLQIDGNVMSLLSKENFSSLKTIPADFCFYSLFKDCDYLLKGPLLPATTLADECYFQMFQNCTYLREAPELPATILAESCYFLMFENCKFLKKAPELPATTLAYQCYTYMFRGCTSLTQVPVLPATTLTNDCYRDMFSGCTSLTTAPELPATTLAYACYYQMFFGCTSLTTAPELPATTLAENCYGSMFFGCTSLTTAPELPATTLADGCYFQMFCNCTSLNNVKSAFTTIPYGTSSLSSWLNRVSSTGTFYKNKNATWGNSDANIPEGWTVVLYDFDE